MDDLRSLVKVTARTPRELLELGISYSWESHYLVCAQLGLCKAEKILLLVSVAFHRAVLQPRDGLPVELSIGCQLDRLQDCLADKPLGLSVREFVE